MFIILVLLKPNWLLPKTVNQRNILYCSGLFLIIMVLSYFINFREQNSSISNFFWTIVTYGSSLVALHIFINLPYGTNDIKSILKFSIGLTLFQIVLGYYQMVAYASFQTLNPFTLSSGAGDSFVGTTFDEGIGNEVAVKISIIVLLFFSRWSYQKSLRNSIILILLCIGWLLPSAIYTLMAGLLVLLYEYLVKRIVLAFSTLRLNTSIFLFTAFGIILVVVFIIMQPNNISYVGTLLDRAYNTALGNETDSRLGKVVYYKDTFTRLFAEYPHAIALGVGPGNYSSRSAWLVSGAYLDNQPSYIPVTPSKAAQSFTLTIWRKENISKEFPDSSSISYQPFSTWLSVLAEFGIIGFLSFVGIFYFLLRIVIMSFSSYTDPYMTKYVQGTKIILYYIFFLFFIDNLFEWPIVMGQVFILVGVLAQSKHTKRYIDKEFSVENENR